MHQKLSPTRVTNLLPHFFAIKEPIIYPKQLIPPTNLQQFAKTITRAMTVKLWQTLLPSHAIDLNDINRVFSKTSTFGTDTPNYYWVIKANFLGFLLREQSCSQDLVNFTWLLTKLTSSFKVSCKGSEAPEFNI